MEIEVRLGEGLIMLPPFWVGDGGLTLERDDGRGEVTYPQGKRVSGGALMLKEGRWGFFVSIGRDIGGSTFDLPHRFHFVDEEPWWPFLVLFSAKSRVITPEGLPALMEEIAAAGGVS